MPLVVAQPLRLALLGALLALVSASQSLGGSADPRAELEELKLDPGALGSTLAAPANVSIADSCCTKPADTGRS